MYYLRLSTLFALVFFFTSCENKTQTQRYAPQGTVERITVYKVGIHPYLNSKKMYSSYRPLLDHLEKNIAGVEFVLETSADYEAYNKKLYQGAFDFSLPNPYQTYNALAKNYNVIAKMKPDSVFRGILVARKDLHIQKPSELLGKTVSFPAPTALAATMMPLYYLHEKGVDTKLIKKKYVGSQYSSIINAYSKDSFIAATWPPPWEAWCKENPTKALEMEVVWETQALINNGFIAHQRVKNSLAKEVATLLVDLCDSDEGKALLKNAGFEGFEYANNATYLVVEEFLQKYEQALGPLQ